MLKQIRKTLQEKENERVISPVIEAWDPLGIVPHGLSNEYLPEIRDLAASMDDRMDASELAKLIADVFNLHLYPYVLSFRQCLPAALDIKVNQQIRRDRNLKALLLASGIAAASISTLVLFMTKPLKRGGSV